jgi:PAS domain S-box-containing protein
MVDENNRKSEIEGVKKQGIKQKQSEGYARSLIEASLDPLVTISPEGKITDVNEASIKATGATREELIGSDFSEYFTEPDKAKAGYEKVLKEGSVSDYPLTIKHKEGKLMDVLYNASVYKDDKGKVIGVFAAARDITAQKQASQYARSLIEASLDPLVTISPEGKITDVNEASIKATGATREELIGSDFSEYFTEPDKAKAGYEKVFKEGSVSDYPLTIKHKEGKFMDVLYNASVYKDDKGNVLGVFAAARDITAQKQASQYARSLIEASLDPLVTISPQGKITDVNEASIRATGVTREELIGSDFSEYFTEPQKAKAGYEKVFKEGSVSDYPLTIKHQNGKLMDVLYNASVYKDDKGKVLGVFAAARDITAQKQASQYARSLIEASLDPLVTISADGKVTDVNKATEKATGVTREQLIGTDFTSYFTQPEKAKAGYEEVFEKGEVRDYLLTIRSVTGKLTNVLYNASVYKDKKGKAIGAFAAAREIGRSELKAAQARELMRTSSKRVFKVGISYKLGRGTVKIHDIDCKKIGIGIIDNVVVKPTSKEGSGKKITAMSYSQSKFPQEMIIMSPTDVKSLGLEEEDTVYVTKAVGADQEVELVEDYDYAPAAGEYEPSKEADVEPEEPVEEKPVEEETPEEEPVEEKPAKKEQPKEETPEEKPAKKEQPKEEPEEKTPVEPAKPTPKEISKNKKNFEDSLDKLNGESPEEPAEKQENSNPSNEKKSNEPDNTENQKKKFDLKKEQVKANSTGLKSKGNNSKIKKTKTIKTVKSKPSKSISSKKTIKKTKKNIINAKKVTKSRSLTNKKTKPIIMEDFESKIDSLRNS